jgi:hypothetical protein
MLVSVSDGEIIEAGIKCDECEDNPAAFFCERDIDRIWNIK